MLKLSAQFISIVFHPLMVMSYGLLMLLMINPYMFGYSSTFTGTKLLLVVWMSSFVLPAFSTMMMVATGLVPSIELKENRMMRVGPLIVTAIFYLWLTRNFYHHSDIPPIFSAYVMGATLSILIAFFINIFFKLSLHSVAMGGWLMLTIFMLRYFDFSSFSLQVGGEAFSIGLNYWLYGVMLLSGIVGTARLLLKAHQLNEVSIGFFVGLIGQVIAFRILM